MTHIELPALFCDHPGSCGKTHTDADARDVRESAQTVGWVSLDGDDYCPTHAIHAQLRQVFDNILDTVEQFPVGVDMTVERIPDLSSSPLADSEITVSVRIPGRVADPSTRCTTCSRPA